MIKDNLTDASQNNRGISEVIQKMKNLLLNQELSRSQKATLIEAINTGEKEEDKARKRNKESSEDEKL